MLKSLNGTSSSQKQNYKLMAYMQEIFPYVTICNATKMHSNAQILYSYWNILMIFVPFL